MKSFLIAWFVAFGLVTVIASGVTWFVARVPQTAPPGQLASARAASENDSGPFSEVEAVEVVLQRIPANRGGDQFRRALQNSATVTYHSFRHWRVCYDDACWVAHGPGRYAEPENDAARQREARPSTTR